MLDQWMAFRNKYRYTISTPQYSPEKAIERKEFIATAGKQLAVLFSPWHTAGRYYEHLQRSLIRQGYAVLQYTLSPEVLKADVHQVVESYIYARNAVVNDLEQLHKAGKYTYLHLIGTSLGNIPLILATDIFDKFDEVTMAAVGSDLARCCWYGLRTQDLRLEFGRQGLTESGLAHAWQELRPANYVAKLDNKKVNLVVSKSDRIIPGKYQMEYLAALEKTAAQAHVTYSHLGHYGTVAKFCLTS